MNGRAKTGLYPHSLIRFDDLTGQVAQHCGTATYGIDGGTLHREFQCVASGESIVSTRFFVLTFHGTTF
jgi:hypothetical protein